MVRPVAPPVATLPPRRWSPRRLEVTVSTMAVATALWLGLTAPAVSPVNPAPPPAAVAVVPAPAAP